LQTHSFPTRRSSDLELVRGSDVPARYGGEEFVVILPDTGIEGAMLIAERLRAGIENYAWNAAPVTASFGVAAVDANTVTRSELLQRCDTALYRSKRTGRNRVTNAADLPIGSESAA
jgi:diguanylate cyclase (GGDEF)-like protein